MKRTFALAIAIVLLFSFGIPALAGNSAFPKGESKTLNAQHKDSSAVPGEMLVKFKEGASQAGLEMLKGAVGAASVERLTSTGISRVKIPGGVSVEEAIEKAYESGLVAFAEPNHVRRAAVWTPDGKPDDPDFDKQWNFDDPAGDADINAVPAWQIQQGGNPNAVVAIVDTGVAYENNGIYRQAPDLANTSFVDGYDFINKDANADDDNGHGTHVCGTIAQSTDNGRGVAGVAFKCSIMPVKVLDREGAGTDAEVTAGIEFAVDHGVDVINLSLGGPQPSASLLDAIDYAESKGVVVCAATGNDGEPAISYPAAFPWCIAVGASNRAKQKASYSNYGSGIDVVAPGGESGQGNGILQQTFAIEGNPQSPFVYAWMIGTSMATPHVSGIAALVKSAHGAWGGNEIRGAVVSTCRDLGPGGWDSGTGYGLVDANAALQAPKMPIADVSAVSPNHVKTGGRAKGVTITGEDFKAPMVVTLTRYGETEIETHSVSVKSSTKLTCDLDLTSAQPGLWTVTARNATLGSNLLEGAFVVDPQNDHTWYLAEGSTASGFEEFILLQNPNSAPANATITFMPTSGPTRSLPAAVGANSRVTVNVNGVMPNANVSAKITADQNIICERSMYWNNRVEGTNSIAVQSPSYSWYFAEGSTAGGFDTYLLIQNPNPGKAEVAIVYLPTKGKAFVKEPYIVMEPNTRKTIEVKKDLPDKDASYAVFSDMRIIAERSMFWDNKRGGHVSLGTTSPAMEWYLAEGSTKWGYDEWVLLENPNDSAAKVNITYMTTTGPVSQPQLSVPGNSRKTVHVNEKLSSDVSVKVTANKGIVAERAMYWNNGTGKAGHCAIGITQPRKDNYLAEGSTDWGFDEYVLVQNPNNKPANIGVRYMTTKNGPIERTGFSLPARSRRTVPVNADLGRIDTSVYVYSNLPIIAERSMYWNSNGGGHVSTGLMK